MLRILTESRAARSIFPLFAMAVLLAGCISLDKTLPEDEMAVSQNPENAEAHHLSDFDFTQAPSRQQIESRWGRASYFGPSRSFEAYRMDTGDRLWLSYSDGSDGRLTRALLLTQDWVPTGTIIFNALRNTEVRDCHQIDRSGKLKAQDIHELWGPPDNVAGSGIDNWIYNLIDGKQAYVVYAGDDILALGGCD